MSGIPACDIQTLKQRCATNPDFLSVVISYVNSIIEKDTEMRADTWDVMERLNYLNNDIGFSSSGVYLLHPDAGGIRLIKGTNRIDIARTYQVWRRDIMPHRITGPAIQEWDSDGKRTIEIWMMGGTIHKGDGPAIVYRDVVCVHKIWYFCTRHTLHEVWRKDRMIAKDKDCGSNWSCRYIPGTSDSHDFQSFDPTTRHVRREIIRNPYVYRGLLIRESECYKAKMASPSDESI